MTIQKLFVANKRLLSEHEKMVVLVYDIFGIPLLVFIISSLMVYIMGNPPDAGSVNFVPDVAMLSTSVLAMKISGYILLGELVLFLLALSVIQ